MTFDKGPLLLAALAAIVAADAVILLGDAWRGTPRHPLQDATNIGLGSAVTPAWSFFAVDPRTEDSCENELWPLPGSACPNPTHGATLVDVPARHALEPSEPGG